MPNMLPEKSFGLLFFSLSLLFPACNSFKPDASTQRLHDIWGLKEIRERPISQFEGDKGWQGAVLELFIAEQRFLLSINGHHYRGKLRAGPSRISFTERQPMIAEDASELEKQFLEVLATADRWILKDLHLFLYSDQQVQAKLIKMD